MNEQPDEPINTQEEPLGAPTYFRPPVEVREALERVARAERRSISNAIVILLEEAIAIRRATGKAA